MLAFVSRALLPLPLLGALEGRWVPTLLVALGLLLLGPLLHVVFVGFVRPSRRTLVAGLDDQHAWHDEASTAYEVEAAPRGGPVEAALFARVVRRLARLEPHLLWRGSRRLRWIRAMLAVVFAFILLGPGVDGLLGRRGVGRGEDLGLGARDGAPQPSAPEAMAADVWLAWFAEDPLPVEALPPSVLAPAEPARPGGGR